MLQLELEPEPGSEPVLRLGLEPGLQLQLDVRPESRSKVWNFRLLKSLCLNRSRTYYLLVVS